LTPNPDPNPNPNPNPHPHPSPLTSHPKPNQVKATREAPLRGGVLADAVGAGKTVNALALVAARAEQARRGVAARPAELQHAGATLVVAPLHCLRPVRHPMLDVLTAATHYGCTHCSCTHYYCSCTHYYCSCTHQWRPRPLQVWHQMLEEFTTGLKHVVIEGLDDLLKLDATTLRSADVVIVCCELLYNRAQGQGPGAYQEHLVSKAGCDALPGFLQGRRSTRLIGSEPDALTGVWVPNSSQDPFGKSGARQEDRDQAAP
jgi:hypothetical protein